MHVLMQRIFYFEAVYSTHVPLGELELSRGLSPMHLEEHSPLPRMSVAARELVLDIPP